MTEAARYPICPICRKDCPPIPQTFTNRIGFDLEWTCPDHGAQEIARDFGAKR